MDYTLSNSYSTDAGTGNRMHLQAQAIPTAVTDVDMNGLTWEMLSVIRAAGLAPAAFDKATPATYVQVRDAISILAANAPITDVISAIKYKHAAVSGCAGFIEI